MTANPPSETERARDFDLIDLFHEIVSRWKLILACIVGFTVMGAIVVWQMDRAYTYLTTIEIGHVASVDGSNRPSRQFVESTSSAVARLESAYIPAVAGTSEDGSRAIVMARSHENVEGLLVLETVRSPANSEAISIIHQEITRRLTEDHARVIRVQRDSIQGDLRRIEHSFGEVEREISEIRVAEDRISSSRTTALEELTDISSQNFASEQYDSVEASANQTNIILERQSIMVNFDRSRQDLVERRRELVDRQRDLRAEAALRSLALTNLRDTEAIAVAVRSVDPVGPGRGLILAVSVLTGIVVGTAVALLLFLFGAVARRRAAERA